MARLSFMLIIVVVSTCFGALQRIPRFATALRDFLSALTSGNTIDTPGADAIFTNPFVLKCANELFPDPAAPLYQDLTGIGRGQPELEYVTTFIFVKYPTTTSLLTCLLDITPPLFTRDALARFAPSFAMSAATMVGHNRGAFPLFRALLRQYPPCVNATAAIVEAKQAASTATAFPTDLPEVGVSMFHKAFDSEMWLFYGATHTVLKPSEAKSFFERLAVVAGDLLRELPRVHGLTAASKKGLGAAVSAASHRIMHPKVTARGSTKVLGRILYTKDMRVITDVISLLLVDTLVPPPLPSPLPSSPLLCALDSIMPAILLRDEFGRSSLFMASIYGNASTQLLLDRVAAWLNVPVCFKRKEPFAAAMVARDVFGYTPVDVVQASRAFDRTIDGGVAREVVGFKETGVFSTGGWKEPLSLSPLALQAMKLYEASGSSSTRCDIDVVDGQQPLAALQAILLKHFLLNKPVLFRGMMSNAPIRASFSLDSIVADFGDIELHTGDIPYSVEFETVGGGKLTLAEYVLGILHCDTTTGKIVDDDISDVFRRMERTAVLLSDAEKQSKLCAFFTHFGFGSRNYAFTKLKARTGGVTAAFVKLMTDFPLLGIHIPAMSNVSSVFLTEEKTRFSLENAPLGATQPVVMNYPSFPGPQFYLGVAGSGAPVHHHENAINALLFGKKNWYLLPAHKAAYSTVSIAEYVVHVLPSIAPEDTPMECVQEAGDVIFVPRHWGHAVLNLQTTTGYALEFPTVWRY